jgi:tRNA pseudouridine55 synthase
MNGILIVDKPAGMTSHDVVARVRRLLKQRGVGHLGTLDPMATGVLPLVLGNLTRLAQFYLKSEKTYEGVIRLGFATDTYDAEGEPFGPASIVQVTLEEVQRVARQFEGALEQVPPPFSAKKVAGVPAYKLARKKQGVELTPVQVEVKELAILGLEEDRLGFRAHVGSGTYMRSIAHDLGQKLGCGAHLLSLRRTQAAEFTLEDAHTLTDIEAAAAGGRATELLIHSRKLLPQMPSITANDDQLALIRCGRTVNLSDLSSARQVKVFEGQKELVAIATRIAGTLFHPKIVLAGTVTAQVQR